MTLDQMASGVLTGVLATAVAAGAGALWRRRLLRRYGLTHELRMVLEALWDENLLRRSNQIARELSIDEPAVLMALEELQKRRLARERNRSHGKFWKITLRGAEYLRQRSWIE
jgi:DNA-binding MarR family transcriptional regulator